jgi:hypothetical protein
VSFSKTISVFAALGSIFAAGATGWKLAQGDNATKSPQLEEKVQELEKQLAETKQLSPVPAPVDPPSATPEPVPQIAAPPSPPPLPPVPES